MPRIRVKNGPSKGGVFDIEDKPLTVGRDPSCGIQILDKGASRQHAEIFRIGEMCFVRDLQSRNGSFVNDNRVDEELLREGDRIQIGATVLVFESASEDEPEKDLEFSREEEETFGQTMTLKLEDLSALSVSSGEGDGSEALRLRALYRLSRLLSEEREEQVLTAKTVEFCCGQVNADAGYIFMPDPQKGNIVPVGMYSKDGKKTSKISRSIIRKALQEKRALLTSDAMQDSRFAARESIVMKQIHSVICAPLSATSEKMGVLYLASHQIQQIFSEDDLELVAAMADMIGLALDNIRIQREQRETLLSTIRVLVRATEMRDPTLRGHSERVATYASGIAAQMHLPEHERNDIQLASLLHNLGTLVTDGESLFGSGRDSVASLPANQKRIKATLELIKDMSCSNAVSDTIRYMEEYFDGSGPQGVAGKDIPVSSQILAVAEEFDTRANSASDATPQDALRQALVSINREGGKRFAPEVVKALLVAHRNDTLYAYRPAVAGEDLVIDPRKNAPKNLAQGRL